MVFTFVSFKKLLNFFCLLLITGAALGKEAFNVTVFIHGTVASTLSIFGSKNLSGDTLDESTSIARAISRFRNHPLTGYDHINGLEGFHEFSLANPAQKHAQKNAEYYLIPAYDDLLNISGVHAEIQNYAIFGWSGLLHNAARKKAGYELYQALCAYRDRIVLEYGSEPGITIVSHSHGGNVALYMAQAEIEQQKKLKVNYLVMYGSPMMAEMAHCIESDFFRNILMIYSRGDEIQPRDMFSSKNGKSHQHMADIVDMAAFNKNNKNSENQLKRYDVCCIANNHDKRVTHTNMWLIGRSTPLSQSMSLLPLMVITPMIIACADQMADTIALAYLKSDLQIAEHEKFFQIYMAPRCRPEKFYAPLQETLKKRLLFWDTCMLNEWQIKNDMTRHPLFNKKTFQVLKSVLLS